MKYIKTFEAKATQKALVEAMINFLTNALPDRFVVKLYSGTINIKDRNIRNRNVGYIYVLGNNRTKFEIALNCRTIEGSDINIAAKYIISKLNDYHIPVEVNYKESYDALYNEQNDIIFDPDYFDDIIKMFEELPTDDLSILMGANKYNL